MNEKLEILKKYNPFGIENFDTGFPRPEYTEKIKDYIGNRLVKVLTGQRRTGKSYIMRQIAEILTHNGVNSENIIFINREFTDFEFLKTHKDLEELVELYCKEFRPAGKIFLFIDEIQLIEKWEKTVNSYSQDYTTEYEVFISGSNSKMLSGELATLLSGRYIEFNIYPFSYTEYTELTQSEQGKESFLNYMNTGGLPELFSLPDKQEIRRNYMSSMKDSILLKDIIQRYKIRDPKLLDDIFSFLVNNASNLISVNSIVNWFKGKKRNTSYDAVASYIGYIEEAFLILLGLLLLGEDLVFAGLAGGRRERSLLVLVGVVEGLDLGELLIHLFLILFGQRIQLFDGAVVDLHRLEDLLAVDDYVILSRDDSCHEQPCRY